MEQVAGRAKTLAKDKTAKGLPEPKEQPVPPPFRKHATKSLYQLDWDPKKYSSDGKESREVRAEKRKIRVFGIEHLGLEEYHKLMQEIDSMTGTDEVRAMVDKRIEELKQRLQTERQLEEAEERRVTRSQVDKPGTSTEMEPIPVGSPKKRHQTEEDRKDVGVKKPKTKEHTDVGNKKPKMPERKNVEGKKPKTPTHKDKGGKKPKTPTRKTNDDVDESENRRKETETEKDKDETEGSSKHAGNNEELTSRKPKTTDRGSKAINTVDKSENWKRKRKITVAVPLLEDDDDLDDDDLMIVDDEDRDENYEPQDDEQDDKHYQMLDDDDDDFQEPPPQARKPVKKEQLKRRSTQ